MLCLLGSGPCAGAAETPRLAELTAAMVKLQPLQQPLEKPGPNDWLAQHREAGQTFREYLRADPVTLSGRRKVIYVQPLGEFTPEQRRLVVLTAEFLGLFYNAAVKVREDLPLSLIPAEARRRHPAWGMPQVLTGYVLDQVLRSRLPADAAVYLAFTASDLWPGEGWNFVFGQASLRDRVGVWSIYRNGDPAGGDAAFRQCLLRTLKTAVHETGHMFSMQHCILHQCGMCGSNHQAESDRRPLWFSAECEAKVWWATGAAPAERYRKLADFCRRNGLKPEADFYAQSAARLGRPAPPEKP